VGQFWTLVNSLLTLGSKTFVERLLLRFAPKVSAVLISANRYRDVYQTLSRAVARAKFCPIHVQGFHGPLAGDFDRIAKQCAVTDWVVSAAL
jgi:molybdopterin-guanine dinucleotide biosynthesis protein A